MYLQKKKPSVLSFMKRPVPIPHQTGIKLMPDRCGTDTGPPHVMKPGQ